MQRAMSSANAIPVTRAAKFRKFVDDIEAAVSMSTLRGQLCRTHGLLMIRNLLAKRPGSHIHLTPTSLSRRTHVSGSSLSPDQKIRGRIYRSVQSLRADILDFICHQNDDSSHSS
ncbi:Protein of unknown function [Bradyrhizobium sp. ORS 285]